MEAEKLTITKDKVFPDVVRVGTQGSVGVYCIEPAFSAHWNGMIIKAVFQPARGMAVEVAWFGKPVPVPWEVTKYSGDASVVFHGYVLENGVLEERILTEPCHLLVEHTLNGKAVNGIPATPTVYEQLRRGLVDDINNALRAAKESGEFTGERGEQGSQGIPGPIGPSNVYILAEGETMEDVPEEYDVAIDPWNPDELELMERYIIAIYRTSGEGKPGGTDIYTIFFSDNTSIDYEVYNGSDGKSFRILGYYHTAEELYAAVPDPEPGAAYGVGTSAPYNCYIYDALSGEWVNNGNIVGIQGAAGKDGKDGADGKSVELQVAAGYIQWRQVGGDWSNLVALTALEGKGILKIEKTGTEGIVDTYTVTFTDGATMQYTVTNGRDAEVADTVTEEETDAVSGAAVYAFVQEMIGTFLNGAS